jgi:hypothetical protein
MTVFRLTRTETWALTSLTLPPFTQESRLLGWLGESSPPDLDQSGPAALNTLEAKGYYHPSDASQPLDSSLAKALSILGAASLELKALIRRGGQATLALFALAGNGAVQYTTDDDSLILHPPLTLSELALQLLPSWFEVKNADNFESGISLMAFLVFKEACLLQDIGEVLDGAETESFSHSELVDYFQQAAGWVDIYHEMGMQDIPASQQLPIASALNELLKLGLLLDTGDGRLQVSQAAEPLRAALSDLDYCSITFSLETPEERPPETAVFLYGAQRLFLLSINGAQIKIGQMAGKTQARLWLGDLLARARQVPLQALYPDDHVEPMEATMIASPPLNLSQPSTSQSPQAVKFCTACGARLNPGARFCGECGTKVGA